jgi:MFS family permease
MNNDPKALKMFWGCFIALVTTSMAFSTRIGLVFTSWAEQFNLDSVQQGVLFGAGIWPFAISIILFSLVIDKIGYKTAMIFSFCCFAIYGLCAFLAHGSEDSGTAYNYLYLGSVILGLGNGTVEAFINPIVATMFSKEKTKWLNILHAGWPGGLVVGGLITAALGTTGQEHWLILIAVVIVPAIIFLVMLLGAEYPLNERVASGTTYREMLGELGAVGAFIASWLVVAQFDQVFGFGPVVSWIIIIVAVAGYYLYCKSFGRPMMILLILIMTPLAITELGTDGWITSLMEAPLAEIGAPAILVLVYTSAIMMILRFNVGPIVGKLGPLGLLATAAGLAIVGLYLLAGATGLFMVFLAATIYALGKTFFWPTMLGVVSEQYPKGGALSLNAISGIGMLSVGIIGGPLIGAFQESNVTDALAESNPAIIENITMEKTYVLGKYKALDAEKVAALPQPVQDAMQPEIQVATQAALSKITIFPIIMLVGYVGLIMYFKGRGGYKPVEIAGAESGGGH